MSNGEMPAAFIGHGNPMNALEANRYTQAWHAFGRAVPRELVAPDTPLVDPRQLVAQRPTLPEAGGVGSSAWAMD